MVDIPDEHDQSNDRGNSSQQSDKDPDDVITEDAAFIRNEPPQDETGPPKVDSEVEILHEKVKKQIIKEGHGQKPANFSTCSCIKKSNLSVLEHHMAYSLSREKTTARLYIMMYTGSVNEEFIEVPIKDVLSRLKGPLFKMEINPEVTQVVDYCHLLPYADILSDWLKRETLHEEPLHVGPQTVADENHSAKTVRKRGKFDEAVNKQIDCLSLSGSIIDGSIEPDRLPKIGAQRTNSEPIQRVQTTGILGNEKIMGDTVEMNEGINGLFTSGSNKAVCKKKADSSFKRSTETFHKEKADSPLNTVILRNETIMGNTVEENEGISEPLNNGSTEAVCKEKADNSFSTGILRNEKIMENAAEKNKGTSKPLNSWSTEAIGKKKTDSSFKRSTEAACKKKADSFKRAQTMIMENAVEKNEGITGPLNNGSTEVVCKEKANSSFKRSTEAVCKKKADSSFKKVQTMIMENVVEKNEGITGPFTSGSIKGVCYNKANISFPTTHHEQLSHLVGDIIMGKDPILRQNNEKDMTANYIVSSVPLSRSEDKINEKNMTSNCFVSSISPSGSEEKDNGKDMTSNFVVSSVPPSRAEDKEGLIYPHHFMQDILLDGLYKIFEPLLTCWTLSYLRPKALKAIMEWIHYEDENFAYLNIGVPEKILAMLACWVEDPTSDAFKYHLSKILDYLWVAEDGMKIKSLVP